MKILPIVNTLLILGFLAVITGTFAMIAYVGYNDQLSHTCFILHSVNFFLLVLRAAIR